MKKIRIMFLATAAMLAAACSSSDDVEQQSAQPENGWSELVTITAGTPGSSEAPAPGTDGRKRVAVDTSSPRKSLWETGDQLTIWTGSCTAANMSENGFTLTSGDGTSTAKFSGRLKSESAPTSSTKLYAVIDNGSDAIDASAGTSVTTNLSVQQGATAETALDYELYYAASTNGERNFNFTHQMALIKWTIKVNGVSDGDKCNIVLSGEGLKNSATLDLATGSLTTVAADGTITLKNVVLNAGNTELYVVLPPCTCGSGITATLKMTSGSKGGMAGVGTLGVGSITIEANNYYIAGTNEFTPDDCEYVDLGLPSGTKWASMNVGATAPEESGDLFAWGETTPKTTFSWDNYKWGTENNLTKYNSTDGRTVLDAEDDAATVNWGSAWRMPTHEECQELAENCYWLWTTDYNGTGVTGYIVYKAKKDGHKGETYRIYKDQYSITDAHIFLPAWRFSGDEYHGWYWSSEPSAEYSTDALAVYIIQGFVDAKTFSDLRFGGLTVRPVLAR